MKDEVHLFLAGDQLHRDIEEMEAITLSMDKGMQWLTDNLLFSFSLFLSYKHNLSVAKVSSFSKQAGFFSNERSLDAQDLAILLHHTT